MEVIVHHAVTYIVIRVHKQKRNVRSVQRNTTMRMECASYVPMQCRHVKNVHQEVNVQNVLINIIQLEEFAHHVQPKDVPIHVMNPQEHVKDVLQDIIRLVIDVTSVQTIVTRVHQVVCVPFVPMAIS